MLFRLSNVALDRFRHFSLVGWQQVLQSRGTCRAKEAEATAKSHNAGSIETSAETGAGKSRQVALYQ